MITLNFRLDLLEPVLATAPGGDPNTDESLPYLPGSMIRGALVQKYLQTYGKDADFTAVFLDGTVRYLNAYPERSGQRTQPTPAHWKLEKDPISQTDEARRRVYDVTREDTPPVTKSIGGPFMQVENGILHTKRPSYEIAVHNARNREMGRAVLNDDTNRSALFRYHALAPNQAFIGSVTGPEALVEKIRPLLFDQVLIGGSSTAGYGLTKIEVASGKDGAHPQVPQAIPADTPFLVYLASDAILRHPGSGQPSTDLPAVLSRLLPGNLQVVKAFSKTGWVGGFNLKWGLPLPQTWAVLMGSVWQLTSDEPISADIIGELEEKGVGDRRAEGFGNLIVNPDWPENLLTPPRSPRDKKFERDALNFASLDDDESALLTAMNQRIARQQLDRHLATAVQSINTKGIRLSNSQLARLRLKVRQQADGFDSFRQYLAGTELRKSADDQFRKSRIKGPAIGSQNFRDWLADLTQTPEKVWAMMKLSNYGWVKDKKWQRPLLGPDAYQLDEALAHDYTVCLIDAVCEQAQKEGRGS